MDDRINESINRIAPSPVPIGRDNPTALATREGYVYRETGLSQIEDIIECGFVRSNVNRPSNQVWWTYGGPKSFHVNKRPILVASCDVVTDFGVGAIFIDDLEEIWFYDEQNQVWNNNIDYVKAAYYEKHQDKNKVR